MGDFYYNGEHSVDIILSDGRKYNTWENFFLAPMARPFVAAPQVKTEYVNVPGADGILDYTEVLTGKPRYSNRSGSWQFIEENGHFEWPELLSNLLNIFHGKSCQIILRDDPDYYYKGRITLNPGFGNKDYSSVTIQYNLDPYKYPVGTAGSKNWKWKELFGNTIYYGSFTVNGEKCHNIINNTDTDAECTISTTFAMKFYELPGGEPEIEKIIEAHYDGYDGHWLATGDNTYTLRPGDNYLYFVGNGLVKFSYERGKTL